MPFPEAPGLPHYLGLEPAPCNDHHCTVHVLSQNVTEDNAIRQASWSAKSTVIFR